VAALLLRWWFLEADFLSASIRPHLLLLSGLSALSYGGTPRRAQPVASRTEGQPVVVDRNNTLPVDQTPSVPKSVVDETFCTECTSCIGAMIDSLLRYQRPLWFCRSIADSTSRN
jgi:hypothetical protein